MIVCYPAVFLPKNPDPPEVSHQHIDIAFLRRVHEICFAVCIQWGDIGVVTGWRRNSAWTRRHGHERQRNLSVTVLSNCYGR